MREGETISRFHPVSLTQTRDFTLALNLLNAVYVKLCVCSVCFILWNSWWYFTVYLIHQLRVKGREAGQKERGGKVFLSVLTGPRGSKLSLIKWHKMNTRVSILLYVSWRDIEIHLWVQKIFKRNQHTEWNTRVLKEKKKVTFTGDVVFAGCGETSAAVTVDGRYPELIPTLRSQIWQNHVLG